MYGIMHKVGYLILTPYKAMAVNIRKDMRCHILSLLEFEFNDENHSVFVAVN
jgi:hypothetical protein